MRVKLSSVKLERYSKMLYKETRTKPDDGIVSEETKEAKCGD
jgi:hypothetical protein